MVRHAITPKLGTPVRERDGVPSDLMDPFDYPVLAECLICEQPVRSETFFAGWEHLPGGKPG